MGVGPEEDLFVLGGSQFLAAEPVLPLLVTIHHKIPALLELLLHRLLCWRVYKPWLCKMSASLLTICPVIQYMQQDLLLA